MVERKEIIPTRRSLLSRLRNWNDQDAWRAFFDTYWKLIYNAGIRAGLSDAEAQDVVQETVIAISKKLPEFVYDPKKGSFKTWLMRQTTWRIASQLRKRLPVVTLKNTPPSSGTTGLERLPDPATPALEAAWDEEWEKNLWDAAIRRVKAKVNPRHFQVFDLCVTKKRSPSQVARDLRINSAKVYLFKHRVSKLLKQEVEELKQNPYDVRAQND
jgi:RNA polymerase sigma factor (sigma-70 family)